VKSLKGNLLDVKQGGLTADSYPMRTLRASAPAALAMKRSVLNQIASVLYNLDRMKVEVKLYGLLRPYHSGPNRSVPLNVEVKEDATPLDVVEALKLPISLARLVFVNDRQAKLDEALEDGDRLSFFSSVVGGNTKKRKRTFDSLLLCVRLFFAIAFIRFHQMARASGSV
jgi:molybdopterin converting factor small subunit